MTKKLISLCFIFYLLSAAAVAQEQDAYSINEDRALFNYQMLCQGCHVGDGRGGKGVPDMKGKVGQFLLTPEGREYLIKVPGAANSALDDKALAELMNWVLIEIGQKSVPADFKHYTEQEVSQLRQQPLMEVVEHRARLLQQISALTNE